MNIALLISGGVDSSVALALLKEQGHEVTAYYLKIWLEDELSFLGSCPWQEDLSYVEAVCKQYEVPLHIVSLQREYWDRVVSYTLDCVQKGLTPNPDMLCNQQIKFGAFFDYIGDRYDKIATGHYAQTQEQDGHVSLWQAPDAVKDQSYFLAYLSQAQLNKALFPIGHLTKQEVRQRAQRYELPNKERKDSQGICFLGKLKFDQFLQYHLGDKPGQLVEYETGKVWGTHRGFWYYTLGQRQGLGLAGGPWYVVNKDVDNNVVYISRNYYSPDKKRDTLRIGACNWFVGAQHLLETAQLSIKLRHGPQKYACVVQKREDDVWNIQLAQDDQGIAPGQFAVLYAEERCLGAGIIQDKAICHP